MTRFNDYFRTFVLRTIGNFLLLSALAGVVYTFKPAVEAEFKYNFDRFIGQRYIVSGDVDPCSPSSGGTRGKKPKPGEVIRCYTANTFGGIIKPPEPLAITPVDFGFGIVIPKIGANAKVVANVDPGNEESYLPALKSGVAQASGTVYPGQIGNSFLFAHSVGNFWEVSRWNAVFYLLRELTVGDEVDIFYKGRRYIYVVYAKKIVNPDDVQYLNPVDVFPKLTLQTCWPPGTTLKRLLVFARLKGT